MKKFLKGLSLLVVLVTLVIPVYAGQNTLYKFINNGDGTYGYDLTTPVKFSNFTSDEVSIPDDFTINKYQFRSAWIGTIGNLNIKNTTSAEEFKTEYNKILDTYEDWNMNALIFQVRPLLDAFYPSQINPWSEFVTGQTSGSNVVGKQGVDPGWDPLEWMIEETHQRGLEYHAWFNPYRVTNTKYSTASWLSRLGKTKTEVDAMTNEELIIALNVAGILADNNYAVLHPENVYRFDEKLYLDPGIPEVRNHVVDTITEVIKNYDVDAIHFDDYFYPYRVGNLYFGNANEDRETFEKYGLVNGYEDTTEGIESWRRDNVTALIEGVGNVITAKNQASQRAIQLGISPFGIWEHKANHPLGSNTPTSSSQTYTTAVFADTYKWVKEEMVDYISPQIYWSFDQGAAPYGELARWWANVVEDTHVDLYIGHANYKHVNNGGSEAAWMNPEEVVNQLKFNQLYPQITGSIFFSYNDIIDSDLTISTEPKYKVKNDSIKLLKAHYNEYQTVIPAKTWLDNTIPTAPIEVVRESENEITWNDSASNDSRYYIVYRVLTPTKEDVNVSDVINDPRNIVTKIWRNGESQSFVDSVENPEDYTYIVTAFDAAHNESAAVVAMPNQPDNPGQPGNPEQPEKPDNPNPPKIKVSPNPTPNTKQKVNANKVTSPSTGQSDSSVLYATLVGVSIIGLFVITKIYRKRNI